MHRRFRPLGLAVSGALLGSALGGCINMGPDYKPPEVKSPTAYKNAPADTAAAEQAADTASTPAAKPKTLSFDQIDFQHWWTVFGDAGLDKLENDALKYSPQAGLAIARVDGARAKLRSERGGEMPQVGIDSQVQIDGQTREWQFPVFNDKYEYKYRRRGDYYNIPLEASYELDLWGRVRRGVESAKADLTASQDDYAGVALTLTAQVADTYFTLRSLDAQIAVLEATRRLRQDALDVNNSRFNAGLTSALDTSRAEVELAQVDSDLAERRRQRNIAEDGLAVLTGRPASEFSLEAASLPDVDPSAGTAMPQLLAPPPQVPVGVPADLLRRRPDIASAERTLAARTADIGVAKAMKLPELSLTGLIGVQSFELPTLLDYPNQVLSGGFSLTAPLFTGGKLSANVDAAYARLRGAYADYKQKVLGAYGEVEDSLGDLKYQSVEANAAKRTTDAAADAAKLSRDQYKAGLVNYLIVIDAERSLLSAELSSLQLTTARYKSTIKLIKSLGGGWSAPPPPPETHWPHLWTASAPEPETPVQTPADPGPTATATPAAAQPAVAAAVRPAAASGGGTSAEAGTAPAALPFVPPDAMR